MIFTERNITIRNDSATINAPVILYRGDKNVEVRFILIESPYKYSNRDSINIFESTDASYAQLVIKTPNDREPIFGDITAVGNNNVTFVIRHDMIDEIEEVGKYDFQIRLFDADQTSMATTPEVVGGFIIKEPIAKEDSNNNITNSAIVGSAVVTNDLEIPAFVGGSYNKKPWYDGDVISKQKLNKMEDGIYETYELSKNNSSQIKEIENDGVRKETVETKVQNVINEKIANGEMANLTIADYSISDTKLQNMYLECKKGKNLFNKLTVTNSKYVSMTDGELKDDDRYCASDYIKVKAGVTYSVNTDKQYALYDITQTYVSGQVTPIDNKITPNINGYVRLSLFNTELNSLQFEEGELITDYEPYGTKYFDCDTIDEPIPSSKLEPTLIKGINRNLFNKAKRIEGYYVRYDNGNIQSKDTYDCSDYIKLEPNTTYTISGTDKQYALYNASKTYTRGFANNGTNQTFTTTESEYYVRLSMFKTEVDNVQITQSDYELPYYEYGKGYVDINTLDFSVKEKINEALVIPSDKSITEFINKPYSGNTFILAPGIHNETVRAWKKEIHLVGTCRETCILKRGTGEYKNPPLEIAKGSISNMTIIADDDEAVVTPEDNERKAYAIHVENDTSQNSTLAIRNCTIKSKWSAAIGIGLRPNFTLILENCTIETTHTEVPGGSGSSATRLHCGALYFHDSATMTGDNQRIILKNCIVKSTGSNAITTLSLCDTNSKAYITAYNNIVWCDENKKNAINHRIAPTGDAWAGNNIFLTEDSFGNNVQELNYNS